MGGIPMGRKKDTKARWEAKWRKQWNEKEKIMRENNMPDSVIEDLRTFEWAQFNSDRRFYDNSSSWDRAYLEDLPEKPKMKEINTVEDLFNAIDDEEIYAALKSESREVWMFLIMRANDMKLKDIARELHMTTNEIYGRIYRFRKKINKKRKK